MAARKTDKPVSISLVRKIKAAPSAIYAAWTEPSLIVRWLAPEADTVTSVTMDLRRGGRFRLEGRHSDGRPYAYAGTYLELAEDRRVALSWSYDGPISALKGGASVVTADIRPLAVDLSVLTLTHEKLGARDAAEVYRVTWAECLDQLDGVACDAACSESRQRNESEARDFFSDGQREVQARSKTRELADRLEAVLVHDHLGAADGAFIARQNMFFLATTDVYGQPSCSYKGGARGFVSVVDERTLLFPDYDGNGMYLSIGNISETGKVALLFVDFERQARMRVLGTASLVENDPFLARYPGAQRVVRVSIESVFSNCPRYVHRMQLLEESTYVPIGATGEAPAPAWKRLSAVADVLPDDDKHLTGQDIDLNKTLNKD